MTHNNSINHNQLFIVPLISILAYMIAWVGGIAEVNWWQAVRFVKSCLPYLEGIDACHDRVLSRIFTLQRK